MSSDLIANSVYSSEKPFREKVAFNIALDCLKKFKFRSLLDVGCATGDFLYFAEKKFPDASFFGIDVDKDLLAIAKEKTKDGCNFVKENIWELNKIIKKYDVVTAFAISGYFDDEIKFLDPLIKSLNKKGVLIVQGLFNMNGITVRTEWKKKGEWQPGLNQLNFERVKDYLEEEKFMLKVHRVKIKTKINFSKEFPHRAFSVNHKDYSLMNGANLHLPDYLLECHKCV